MVSKTMRSLWSCSPEGTEHRGTVRIRGASALEPSAFTTASEPLSMFLSVGGTGYA